MCGILAYFDRRGISQVKLKQSLNALKKIDHRGPDGEGVLLINSRTGEFYNLITNETPKVDLLNSISLSEAETKQFDLVLGHRRLSIIDVSVNGHQPMNYNANWIVFNGEVFNYIELREELKLLGYKFRTESDTEVIMAAYEAWGEKCLERFNGMFSIVLFDNKTKQLFIANDRFGVKPLYKYQNNNELLLVSELRQIKEFGIQTTFNSEAIKVLMENFYLDVGAETFFNEITRFQASHFARFDLSKDSASLDQKSYYEIKFREHAHPDLICEEFDSLLKSAVKLRLRSDVPIGFSSSGGLDSSAILYKAHELLSNGGKSANMTTFSAIFPGLDGDESKFIKLVEEDLKNPSCYTNPLEEFSINDFEDHISHQEFPIKSTAYYAEWCVCRLVNKQKVKVLLTGQGGDEILAGYHHHFYRYCRQLIMSGKVLKYLSLLRKYAEIKGEDVNKLHKKIFYDVRLAIKFKLGLADLGDNMTNKWNKASTLIELLKIDMTETMLPSYLRSEDRDAMAFGIETRQPFLDYRIVDFCFSLPDEFKIRNGWQKWLLREVLTEVPEAIRYRKDKKGYSTPQTLWIEQNKKVFESYLEYIPEEYLTLKSTDPFLKYSLGAWFKLNK